MASNYQPAQYRNDSYHVHPDDGFKDLRSPTSWLELSKTSVYWHWFLYFQNTPAIAAPPAPAGGMRTEVSILCNAFQGHTRLEGSGRSLRNIKANNFVLDAGAMAFEVFKIRGLAFLALDALFQSNRLHHVDEAELVERGLDHEDCYICYRPPTLTPSDIWLDPVPAPKSCFPELVKFMPLGKDDRIRFTGILTEIWDRIYDFPPDLLTPDSEPIRTLEVCCKHLSQTIMRYAALSDSGKLRAEVQHFHHLKSDRSWEIELMMDNERRAALRLRELMPLSETDEPERLFQEHTVETSCRHRFGIACLGEWLVNQDSCPTCRRVLLPPFPMRFPYQDMLADLLLNP